MSKDPVNASLPVDDDPLPAYSALPPDAFNPVQGMIPPRRYQLQHDGFMKGVRIWIVDPSNNTVVQPEIQAPALDYSSGNGFNPDEKRPILDEKEGAADVPQPAVDQGAQSAAESSSTTKGKGKEKKKKIKFKCIDPAKSPGHYYVKRVKMGGTYALFEGPGPDDQFAGSRKVIDISGEGFFSKKSSYTEVNGQCRHARMYGTPPWYSCNRTLEDFEGKTWLFRTISPTWTDDIEITRDSDGTQIAFFDLAACSFSGVGILDVKVPLPQDLFYLILSAWYVKYNVDAQRRAAARSNAS